MGIDNSTLVQKRVSFAGFVCFWRTPRQPGELRRQRFFSIYGDLRQTLEQELLNDKQGGPNCKLVRVAERGRRFLGFVWR